MERFVKHRRIHPKTSLPRHSIQKLGINIDTTKFVCDRLKLVATVDTFAKIPQNFSGRLRQRTRICETVIIAKYSMIAVVAQSGYAAMFDSVKYHSLTPLNPSTVEAVQTVLFNKHNDSIIVVYTPYSGSLRCAAFTCQGIRESQLVPVTNAQDFIKIRLSHPAFFEFDETNYHIGVACMESQSFDFWDMKSYKKLFEIRGDVDNKFQELRVSDTFLVLLKAPQEDRILYTLYKISNGRCISEDAVLLVQPFRDVTFLELCSHYMLFKQDGASMRLLDMETNETTKIASTREMNPLGFVFYDVSQTEELPQSKQSIKRFFVILEEYIEFWMISNSSIQRLHKVYVPGLRDPDLVTHSNCLKIIAICTNYANNTVPSTFKSALSILKAEHEESHLSCDEISNPLNNPKKSYVKPKPSIQIVSLIDGSPIKTVENTTLLNSTAVSAISDNCLLVVGLNNGIFSIFGSYGDHFD